MRQRRQAEKHPVQLKLFDRKAGPVPTVSMRPKAENDNGERLVRALASKVTLPPIREFGVSTVGLTLAEAIARSGPHQAYADQRC